MRRFLSLILTVSVFLSLAAMGGAAYAEGEAPPEGEAPAEEAAPEPIVLNFRSTCNGDEPRAQILQTAADLYEIQTGVHVSIEWWGSDLPSYIAGSLEAGESVDIFEGDSLTISSDLGQFTYDLTDMAAAAGYAEHSYGVFNDRSVALAGHLNCITEIPQVGAFFYDQDAFKAAGIPAAPTTWGEFLDDCAKLKTAGYGPLALDNNFAHFFFYHHLVRYLGESGVTALRDNGGWSANESVVRAAQDMIDLRQAGYLVFGAPEEYPGSQNKLGYGLAAMVLGYDSVVPEVESATLANMRWGAFKYPAVDGGVNDDATYVNATSLAISSYCAHPQEAFNFIMYLVTGEYDQNISNQYTLIPTDTANTAPACRASAAELLKTVTVPMNYFGQLWYMPYWDSASDMILGLFRGDYATGAEFCAAIDTLYPEPEAEVPAE